MHWREEGRGERGKRGGEERSEVAWIAVLLVACLFSPPTAATAVL